MSDFKQAVEEIQTKAVFGLCEECSRYHTCHRDRVKCFTDAILAAHNKRLDEIAEGMPSDFFSWAKDNRWGEVVSGDMRAYFMVGVRACQAHVKAQKE